MGCGNQVSWGEYNVKKNGHSYNLDRKDCLKEYVMGNLVVCCWMCNNAKSNDFSYEEWVVVGKALREYGNPKRGQAL